MEQNQNQTKKKKKSKTNSNGRFGILLIILIIIIAIAVCTLVNRNKADDEVADAGEVVESEETELGEYETLLEDGSKLNTSSALAETKTLDGVEVTNNKLVYGTNGNAILTADVTNTTDSDMDAQAVKVDILDSEGEVIVTMNGVIQPLEAGETNTFSIGCSADVANAYDFVIYK